MRTKRGGTTKAFYEDDGSDDGGGDDYGMLYPFHEDSPAYIRGFEQGQIAELVARNIPVNRPVRPLSVPQLETMCKAHRTQYEVKPCNDEWVFFVTKARTEPHVNDIRQFHPINN